MYLGTGDPNLDSLVPNRMFKNVAGQRFAEITASSGTGHLQKGHGVACGDWDRDGSMSTYLSRRAARLMAIAITTFSSKIQGKETTG